MIYIEEISPTIKLSGTSSFLVSFDFRPELVNAMKTLPIARWDKRINAWEISKSDLDVALDTLCFFDEIELKLLPETNKNLQKSNNLTEEEIANLNFKPYKHQLDGINFGLNNSKWLLLDNPGCGKTNQLIGLAETLKNRGEINHCLVIAGINSLKSNLKKEILKYGKESCIIIGEKKNKKTGDISKIPMTLLERAGQLKNPISEFFVIINVESLRDDRIIKAIQTGPNKYGMIAIDEVHKCLASGKKAIQSQNILKLKADYMLGMSGTLILNNPLNCWGPLNWIDKDSSTLTNFKAQYFNFGGFNGHEIIGYKNLDLLKEEIDSCSLRRLKENLVDLPPKVIKLELLDMNEDHRKFYEAIKKGVKEEADKVELNTQNLLALTTRLRQASILPDILTTENISSTKIDRCLELVEELVGQGEKVVILDNFKQPIYKLAELLSKYEPLVCTGDQTDKEVSDSIDKFQNDSEHLILLGTLAKMSTGLTLNRAGYMIMLSEHWTYAMNDQAINRIVRINNTRSSLITILACKDTIDERVHEVAQIKQELSDFMVDNKPSERFNTTLKDIITSL